MTEGGRNPTQWPHRLEVRTAPFQGACRGSIPLGVAMTQRKIIESFTLASGYGFLSNFHTSTIYVGGKSYPSVEHAYQAAKTLDDDVKETIRKAKSPGEAKKLGKCVQLRSDWDAVKVDLMRGFLRQKFDSPFLRHQLLQTGDAELIYGNTWNDRFWGVCRGTGQNWLGKLLMQLREEFQVTDSLEQP